MEQSGGEKHKTEEQDHDGELSGSEVMKCTQTGKQTNRGAKVGRLHNVLDWVRINHLLFCISASNCLYSNPVEKRGSLPHKGSQKQDLCKLYQAAVASVSGTHHSHSSVSLFWPIVLVLYTVDECRTWVYYSICVCVCKKNVFCLCLCHKIEGSNCLDYLSDTNRF